MALLELLHVFPQLDERLIVVILARDVCAQTAELIELLLQILRRRLDLGPDALDEILVTQFTARIADDLDIVRKEVVAVLRATLGKSARASGDSETYKAEQSWELDSSQWRNLRKNSTSAYGLLLS